MRRTTVMLTLLLLAGLASAAWAGGGRDSHTKRIPNMPRGWTWPPSGQMQKAGELCLTGLTDAGVSFDTTKASKATRKINTPVVNPTLEFGEIKLEPTFRKAPFVMDCHLALGLEKESAKLRALGVSALRFSTIHDYHHVKRNGRKTNILSRHAIGLAMDVFEVSMADGTVLVIKKDYRKGSKTLRAIEAVFEASELFRTPLTPGNDPRGHDDHFHLEARMPLR